MHIPKFKKITCVPVSKKFDDSSEKKPNKTIGYTSLINCSGRSFFMPVFNLFLCGVGQEKDKYGQYKWMDTKDALNNSSFF